MSKSKTVSPTGFVVIGAGLPRTGTYSMHLAMNKLLGGHCYHMASVFAGGDEHANFWDKALRRQLNKEDWDNFLKKTNSRCGVDYPISFYWKDLMRHYPDAKIILSTRSPETWYKSVRDSIHFMVQDNFSFPMSWVLGLTGTRKTAESAMGVCYAIPDGDADFDCGMFGAIERGEAASIEFFNKWQDEVIRTVPKERLLIHQAKEGYGPICEFLGLPVPDEPYPRVNDTAEQLARHAKGKRMAYAMVFGIPVVLAAGTYFLLNHFGVKLPF